MSLNNSGFDGTVTERDFSRIMRGAGVRDSVETVAAWAVTQGTGRQVSVAPGVAYAAGVVSDSGVAILAALPTPVNGQFHLVVRRINWSSNTVTVATIPHTTTATTIPTAPPAGFPVFNDNTGVLVDQHLAWAWVRSTDTTLVVFDLRSLPPARGVDLPVANFAALPTVGNFVGKLISVLDTGITFRWDGSAWFEVMPFTVLGATGNQSATGTPTPLALTAEISDRSNMHDNATNNSRIIARVAGVYEVAYNLYNNSGTGDTQVTARLNGSTAIRGSRTTRTNTNTSGATMTAIFSLILAVNDYVEIMVSGSGGVFNGGAIVEGAMVTMKMIG